MTGWFWVIAMGVGAAVPLAVGAAFAAAGHWIDYFSVAKIRQRRRAAGQCEHCAYSLIGNVSGICPECGKAAPPIPMELLGQPQPASLHLRRWAVVSGIAVGIVVLGSLLFKPIL